FEIEIVEPVEGLVDQGLRLSCQTSGEYQEKRHPPQVSASRHLGPVDLVYTAGAWRPNQTPGRHGIAPSGTLRAVPFDNAQWEVRMPVWNGPLAPMRIHGTQIG